MPRSRDSVRSFVIEVSMELNGNNQKRMLIFLNNVMDQ
jgi:hypothetical protein